MENKIDNKVIIYTDGGCHNNGDRKGNGSQAFLILNDNKEYIDVICQYVDDTTNNRMEMQAVIDSIKYVGENYPGSHMTIVSDSGYLVKGFTHESYLDRWVANNWKTYNNKPVKNVDMWRELYNLSWHNHFDFIHIRGHNKDKNPIHAFYNDICDRACTHMMNVLNNPGFIVTLRYTYKDKLFEVISTQLLI